jgi:serine phosphatase RsbU (regulator of sigma subunit)
VPFYTDGLTEVFRADEEFGQDRLLLEFSNTPAQQADGILDALWVAIQGFSGGGPQEDDMTALVLCHLPASAPVPHPHSEVKTESDCETVQVSS